MTARVVEATIDRDAYRRALAEILDGLDNLNSTADREIIDMFGSLRREVSDIVGDLGDSASGPLYQATLEALDQSMTSFANRWGIRFDILQQQGWNLGEELAASPLEAGLEDTITIGRMGVTTDQMRILAQFRTDLVGGATSELHKRIRNEVAAVSVGAKSFHDASIAIGRNLTDRNHFSTIMHRARAIMVTEIGRAQSLATHATQLRAAEDIPELRKRWLNAHLPGARETHLSAEARYAENGTIGPIPIDQPFTIGGFSAMYPHDPSLPAKESVHCHCVSISVIVESPVTTDPKPGEKKPLTDQDAERQPKLSPREEANRKRLERLGVPLDPPAGYEKWAKTKQLKWLEDQMEADWPIGVEFRDAATIKTTKLVEMPSGRKRRRTIRDVVAKVKGADLPTSFDLKGMDPAAALPAMNALRSLAVRFPEVAERLAYVGTYRGAKGAEWKPATSKQFGSNIYAHASVDGRRIGVNAGKYGNADEIAQMTGYDYKLDYHPVADPTAIIVHEFGHQVENWIHRESDRFMLPMAVRVTGFGSVGSVYRTLQSYGIGTTSGPGGYLAISRYAAQSSAEGWAETFSAWWYRTNEIKWTTPDGITVTGAKPNYGNNYDRGGADGETLLDRFGRVMDLFSGTKLADLPNVKDMPDFSSLSDADKAAYVKIYNEFLAGLGTEFGPHNPIDWTP